MDVQFHCVIVKASVEEVTIVTEYVSFSIYFYFNFYRVLFSRSKLTFRLVLPKFLICYLFV